MVSRILHGLRHGWQNAKALRMGLKRGWCIWRFVVLSVVTMLLITGSQPVLSQEILGGNGLAGGEEMVAQWVDASAAEEESGPRETVQDRINQTRRAIQVLEGRSRSPEEKRELIIHRINLGRAYSELGQQARACETLTYAFQLTSDICFSDAELSRDSLTNSDRNDTIKRLGDHPLALGKGLRVLGDVFRTVGQLDASEIALLQSLEKLSGNTIEEAKTNLSLGDTYRAMGSLERDRQAPPQYEYTPWKHVSKCIPREKNCLPQKTDEFYRKSRCRYLNSTLLLSHETETFTEKEERLKQCYTDKNELNIYPNKWQINAQEQSVWLKSQLSLLGLYISWENRIENKLIENEDEKTENNWQISENIINNILNDSNDLITNSDITIYSIIELATNIGYLAQNNFSDEWSKVIDLLNYSVQKTGITSIDSQGSKIIVNASNFSRSEISPQNSYVLGKMAGLYEYASRHSDTDTFKTYLGEKKLYLNNAEDLTQRALEISQASHIPEITYQWQWQIGRLLTKEDNALHNFNYEEGLKFYETSVNTLEEARNDLLLINSDIQFSFRDNVEPLYRELLSLILEKNSKKNDDQVLEKSVYYLGSLQLAELENFIRCRTDKFTGLIELGQNTEVSGRITNIRQETDKYLDELNESIYNHSDKNIIINNDFKTNIEKIKTTILYTVTTKDNVFSILQLPPSLYGKNNFISYSKNKNYKEIEDLIFEIEDILKDGDFINNKQRGKLNEFYEITLDSFEEEFSQIKLEHIIYSPDRIFQNIPLYSAYDQDYLIRKNYSISRLPAIQLLKDYQFQTRNLKTLLAGTVNDRNSFLTERVASAIDNQICSLVGIISKNNDYLCISEHKLDQGYCLSKMHDFSNLDILDCHNFTKINFSTLVKNEEYNIIHIASHGQFSSTPDNSYILTDDRTNYNIKMSELGRILSKHLKEIDLLFLSACETAQGDNRAVLGIAGVAIRSGAKSTISPVLSVEASITNELVESFYRNFMKLVDEVNKGESSTGKTSLIKARALKLAQIEAMELDPEQSPRDWAGFIQVGL
ncbi:MAG: CHAT domain-containing protein [Cyanobacteria bacterium P01_F01_bin.150]